MIEREHGLVVPGVAIPVPGDTVFGDLSVPEEAMGLVIFCHGSGSSRFSVRNREVAAHLQGRRLATLLMDLLTEREARQDEATGHWRFDVSLLAERVRAAAEWAGREPHVAHLPLGLFGASTGAAAALVAAAELPDLVRAVVSRGGRPDLAMSALPRVRAPVLLIVGGADHVVLDLNKKAARHLPDATIKVIPGATHLFEEPGALAQVAAAAADWFLTHLPAAPAHGQARPTR